MNRGKKTIIFVLLVLFISLYGTAAVADSNVTMRAKPGFNGVYKINSLVMVQVIVENKGPDLTGRLVLIPKEHMSNRDNINYFMDIKVPAGETKKVAFLLPGEVVANNSQINLIANNRIMAWSPLEGLQIQDGLLVIGISERGDIYKPVVDSFGRGDYPRIVTAKTIEAGDLPEKLLPLKAIDLIVLDGPLDGIPTAHKEVLKSWVAGGGILIISQGDATGQILFEKNQTPLLYRQPLGEGAIITSTFDLMTGSGLGRDEELELWWGLMESELLVKRSHISHMNSWGNYWSYVDAANYFEDIASPNLVVYAGILAAYVLLIGPVLYLVLRRFDKRDLAWIVIPAAAIVLTLGIMGAGKNRIPGDGIVQIASNINILNSQTAFIEGAAAAIVPKGGSYSFEIARNTNAAPVMRGVRDTTINVKETGEQIVNFNRVEYWTIRNIYFTSEHKNLGAIEGNLVLDGSALKGTLTNNTGLDLQDVLLLAGARSITIGNWPAGSEVAIAENLEWKPGEVFLEWERSVGPHRGMLNQAQQRLMQVEYEKKHRLPMAQDVDRKSANPLDIPYTGFWNITISGWAENDLGIAEIARLNTTNKSKHLVNQVVTVDLQDENRVFFPWGHFKPVYKSNVEYNYKPGEREIIVQGTNTVDFEIGHIDIEKIYHNFSLVSSSTLEYSLYNWQTDDWYSISSGELAIITQENAHSYLSEKGVLRLRIASKGGYREIIPEPAIQVLGRYDI